MDVSRMHESIEKLSSWFLCECEKGQDCFDLCAAGQVADMMKDLADAMEHREKQKYYEELTCYMKKEVEEMEKAEKEGGEGRYGYDHWHYASGKFAPTGRGHRVGYTPDKMMYDGRDIHDGMEGMYGYPRGDMSGRSSNGSDRMGYPMHDMMPARRDGIYNDYKTAKKHYTETKDESAAHKMNEKIEEHVHESLEDMKEMWDDASPEVRRKMKANLTKLMEEWAKTPV